MARRITGRFTVRREAELAVEHLVQEYGVDRSSVEVRPEGQGNTAGVTPSGADTDPATGDPGASAQQGMILVTATVEDAMADRAQEALRQAAAG
jgi:hypothetical protein